MKHVKNILKILPRHSCHLIVIIFVFMIGACATPSPAPVTEQFKGTYLWPPPPATPRIQWLRQWSNRYDFGKPNQVMEFLIGKERVEQLRRPNGVIADASGNVFIADSEAHVVFVFDLEKNTLRFIGLGRLAAPTSIAVNNKLGIVYVSDSRLDKVFGFDKNTDDVRLTIGGPSEFKNPSGMVYDEQTERLYISDTQNHTVKAFDQTGHLLFSIGKRGTDDGEFNFPSALAMDNNGRLYVVDSFNFRVQIFGRDGNFIRKFGKLGDSSGYFSRPQGIGVDSDGNIYVVDTAFNNFQIFNDTGQLLLWVGNAGRKPGEFYLPTGLYVGKDDKIYVSDTFNRRVQVFQYLKEQK